MVAEFQHRRRLSIDAEDKLFKSLQGLQERNNSRQRQQRTNIASKRRNSSLDLKEGQRTNIGLLGNHSCHINRKTSLDLNASKAAASSGSYHTRRQRRNSINNSGVAQRHSWSGQKNLRNVTPNSTGAQINNGAAGRSKRKTNRIRRRGSTGMADSPEVIPKSLNNSVQTNIRNVTPGVVSKPQSLRLQKRQSSGGTARKAYRLGKSRRASTGMGPEVNPVIIPKRPSARRSNPEIPSNPVTATGPPLVIRSFSRRRSLCSSPTSSPTSPAGCNFNPAANQKSPAKSPRASMEWTETTSKADLLRGTKPPRLDNSITSWTSSCDDDSEITDSTKPLSERTALSDRSDNADLNNLLGELKDPAELERRRMDRECLSRKLSSKSITTQTAHNDKVAEQSSTRSLKTFLQRSKRGYVQQANLDAP